MMPVETELKFKLSVFPNLDVVPYILTQTYIDIDINSKKMAESVFNSVFPWDHIKELRVREKFYLDNASYTLTLKSDGFLDRDEYEIKIDGLCYGKFMELNKLGTINKFRYGVKLPDTGLTAELDVYCGKLSGLYIVEVEYNKEDYPDNSIIVYDLKKFFGDDIVDVTFDQQFKNRCLAMKK